ncbi:MAG: exodeoxyribonuclease VII small subunit [Oscillospiraceae bacterium]|nr:exodeoxyribonuclease VII small subunit [Oscillospiraceae bacterium]
MTKSSLSFEQSMERLDAIVKQLEKGEAPLNESLALFEEGTALIASCGKMLDSAEQKVVMLKKGGNGEPVEVAFEGGE